MNEEQLEVAAREYCRLMNLDPDGEVLDNTVGIQVWATCPRWRMVAMELKDHEARRQAIEFAMRRSRSHELPDQALSGRWRVSEHGIFCGTLHVADFNFDTDPSSEFRESVYAQMERMLNSGNAAAEQPNPFPATPANPYIAQADVDFDGFIEISNVEGREATLNSSSAGYTDFTHLIRHAIVSAGGPRSGTHLIRLHARVQSKLRKDRK